MRTKNKLWKRILLISVIVLLVGALIFVAVKLVSNNSAGTKNATAQVRFGSLSSNLSSNGLVKCVATDNDIPLAYFISNADSEDDAALSYNYANLAIALYDETQPILYQVASVNADFYDCEKDVTAEEDVVIMTLYPVTVNWTKAKQSYQNDFDNHLTTAENVQKYLLSKKFIDTATGTVNVDGFSEDFFITDTTEENLVVVKTSDISDKIADSFPLSVNVSYTVSELTVKKDDYVSLSDNIIHVSFEEWVAAFSLSEYDAAPIHEQMLKDESVYAAVSVNALDGKTIVAEILKIETGSNVSGVSYFTLTGRLLFPAETVDADGDKKADYTRYGVDLSEENVTALGVEVEDIVTKDYLLSGYSVTITAQKTVASDALIVPTKCIYYTDSKSPYVIVVDEEGYGRNVAIKIQLSTGSEAAIEPKEAGALKDGDNVRYTEEQSLLGSLLG